MQADDQMRFLEIFPQWNGEDAGQCFQILAGRGVRAVHAGVPDEVEQALNQRLLPVNRC
jgi:hypothetical protein